MVTIISNNGILLDTQQDILNETKNYYKKLYSKENEQTLYTEEILKGINIPKLSEEDKISMEGELTFVEMQSSLKKMTNITSPGNDGFTVELFKFFWRDLGHFLVRSFNYAFYTGTLSLTQKQGVITCIPEGNKDKTLLKNWRPISLLNVSYKIASSSIASRIKQNLGKIIHEDQTGFIPSRLMGTNIRILYDILFYTEEYNIPGLLLLIDFASAFDTLSWTFMKKVLELFNFGQSIRTWISLFYTNIESCVLVNGHMSDWFYPQRGCRQGDSLSPYLFILSAEILSIMIRENKKN